MYHKETGAAAEDSTNSVPCPAGLRERDIVCAGLSKVSPVQQRFENIYAKYLLDTSIYIPRAVRDHLRSVLYISKSTEKKRLDELLSTYSNKCISIQDRQLLAEVVDEFLKDKRPKLVVMVLETDGSAWPMMADKADLVGSLHNTLRNDVRMFLQNLLKNTGIDGHRIVFRIGEEKPIILQVKNEESQTKLQEHLTAVHGSQDCIGLTEVIQIEVDQTLGNLL
jgi:hypothetical protein